MISKIKVHYIYSIIFLLYSVLITNELYSAQLRNHAANNNINDSIENKFLSEINNYPIFQSFPQGFDYNNVTSIIQDYYGYMWFGTADGLIRFDGINIYVYENNPDDSTSICHNSINALVEDINKNLWIGTPEGLNLYNREKDNFIDVGYINPNLSRFINSYISALCVDNKSLLWVGTIGDGIKVYDHKKQIVNLYPYNIDNPIAISSNRINSIAIDGESNIWIGTQNGLNLFSYEINGFRHFYSENDNSESLNNNHIITIEVDHEDNLWIGTKDGGLNRLIKKNNDFSFKRYYSNNQEGSLSNNSILSIQADKKGYLWIGTENGGLNQLNINTDYINVFKVKEGNPYSLSSNSIWSLYNDNEGRLWIGTYNRGINVIDDKFNKFESYQRNIFNKNSLPDNDVRGFTEDKNGYLWIATDGGGICRFNSNTRQFDRIINNDNHTDIIVNNAIQAIIYDSDDNLWVGTWGGGIDRFNKDGVRIKNYKIENELGAGNNNIFCIYEDLKGNIWAGTAGSGLFQYLPLKDEFDIVTCKNPTVILDEGAYVTTMFEDSEGTFWIGTLYGLVILKNSTDQQFICNNFSRNNYSSLSSNNIAFLFEDKKNRFWVGTGDNGLNLYNNLDSTFIVFQEKDGLASNSIKGILEDNEGYLWVTTNKGITKFNYDSLSFNSYNRDDGLNSNEFYAGSCLRTRNGEFYLGGENGFNVFYPEKISNNDFIPPVYLSNFKINNIQAEIGTKNSPLDKYIGETTEITLNHKQTSFTIEFVALNYTRPSRNQFSYKLENFDDDWTYISNKRSASYTNIKPGKYVFKVKGSNNDGVWNNNPTELGITIKPPFWKTWWAILIYIFLISVLTYVSLKIWNERIKIKNQLKLEKLAREKEHELNESNIQFFTNISHEFRTPLSLIIAPLESLISSTRSKMKDQLMVVYRNAERLLRLTNNLMDFRKL
ncbi:two-component regulator propeller domain-containing protein, partial [Bacteroidota bacterium]